MKKLIPIASYMIVFFLSLQNILYTGSVDCSIRGWDIRNPKQCLCELTGHRFAVRRIKVGINQKLREDGYRGFP